MHAKAGHQSQRVVVLTHVALLIKTYKITTYSMTNGTMTSRNRGNHVWLLAVVNTPRRLPESGVQPPRKSVWH